MRVSLFGSPVDALTMHETVAMIDNAIDGNQKLHHVVVNAAKLVAMQKSKELHDSVVSCDLINADGQAVVWASRFLNKPLPERVAGIDLMFHLFELAGKRGYKVFLLGATEEVVSGVVAYLKNKYGEHIIAGFRNGYYMPDEEPEIAQRIAASDADMLFVAISSPKKEVFLNQYKDILNVPFIMGVGGSFDIIAGKTTRAPLWMQKAGLEWFYRLIQEPGRMWKRYLVSNLYFIKMVMQEKLRQVYRA